MSSSDLHIYGGFNLSPYLAMRMFEVVDEIAAQNMDLTLSHVDDDQCEVCRKAAVPSGPPKEDGGDAAEPDRSHRGWTA
jgi:hypothetical protein